MSSSFKKVSLKYELNRANTTFPILVIYLFMHPFIQVYRALLRTQISHTKQKSYIENKKRNANVENVTCNQIYYNS